jgi:D-alanyl-D-alanine carboxypeptidase
VKKKIFRISALLIALVIIFGFFFTAILGTRMKVRAIAPKMPHAVFGATTSARAMCTMDLETGRVFYEHNADAQIPLASTTKIITAIAVIENFAEHGRDLDEKFKICDKAVGIEGTSIYLKKGEELSARELLLGLMLRSGNDASVALAIATSRSVTEFADIMNQIATRAGAENSQFKNPHGLDEEGHFTTARDLAKITVYAMRNPIFREITKTQTSKIDGTEYPRVLHNKNRLLKSLDGCVGVKTGFTKKAGRCYVAAREKDGRTTICVVLNCGPMFEEAATLMTSAAEQFPTRQLITTDEFISDLEAIAIEDFTYPLSDAELDRLKIALDGEEIVITLDNKEIYRAQCNVL